MCILALITHYSPRFPFILISNRDELLDRLTYPLAVDAATGVLSAVDGVAGGSWLGLAPQHGRLAVVTNCRRAPSAPLRFHSAAEEQTRKARGAALSATAHGVAWRGAAPLTEALAHTKCIPCPVSPPDGNARTLVYEPPTSRGTIVREFLMDGRLPGQGRCAEWEEQLPAPLRAPYYAGYNLVTCDSLFGGADDLDGSGGRWPSAEDASQPFAVRYTTNRFHVEDGVPLSHGEVHCLQNSFLDDWVEPKCRRLRSLFEGVLQHAVQPLSTKENGANGRGEGLTAVQVRALATAFADTCLCDTSRYDLRRMMEEEEGQQQQQRRREGAPEGQESPMTLKELLHSADPRLGFTDEELQGYFPPTPAQAATRTGGGDDDGGASPITDGGSMEQECYLQRSIFMEPHNGYGTRTQSVVLTERCDNGDGVGVSYRTHFCQRPVGPVGNGGGGVSGPWVHYVVTKKGGAEKQ